MKIAFQGEPGAYSEAATLEHFGAETMTVPCESFDLVFAAVENGQADYGMIPIENSLAGSIHRNYDLLIQHSLAIVGEHYLRVRHCLITHHGVAMSDLTQAMSHPQALAQCEGYLKKNNIKPVTVYDTAGSVKMLQAEPENRTTAAIASRRAAQIYGMNILAEGIEDDTSNFTHFLAIAPKPVTPVGEAKTSIVFTLKNMPGALFKALSVFALRDIDLTKIESRPLVGTLWEYLFYIDFAGSQGEPHVDRALQHLGEYALMLRVLGSYKRQRLG